MAKYFPEYLISEVLQLCYKSETEYIIATHKINIRHNLELSDSIVILRSYVRCTYTIRMGESDVHRIRWFSRRKNMFYKYNIYIGTLQ